MIDFVKYLILHKVREEPAFDIAEKIQLGDEEGWIIPTSGHRAYPILAFELDKCLDGAMGIAASIKDNKDWEALRDHYQVLEAPNPKIARPSKAGDIANLIGFNRFPKEERRRA